MLGPIDKRISLTRMSMHIKKTNKIIPILMQQCFSQFLQGSSLRVNSVIILVK